MPALESLQSEGTDQATGIKILRSALEAPMRKIAENAGKNGDVIIQNVRAAQKEKKDKNIGYDVLTEEYVNMIKAGIIDPAKVTRA